VTYLLDADTLNYLLKARSPVTERFREAIRVGADFALSLTVHYQITRYLKLKGASRVLHEYRSLVSGWATVGLDNVDWDTAADLWAQRHQMGKPIEDSDLLIAVMALRTGATLVTNNLRHFTDLGLVAETWTVP
jgi:predicted nucleic acid-binding protein